jgi:hypothetical protein
VRRWATSILHAVTLVSLGKVIEAVGLALRTTCVSFNSIERLETSKLVFVPGSRVVIRSGPSNSSDKFKMCYYIVKEIAHSGERAWRRVGDLGERYNRRDTQEGV